PLNEQFKINCLFLTQNQLHDPNQSGYKPAHCTKMALIAVTEKLHATKAAKQLGVTGSAWRWFQSYLDGQSYQ
ncbi:hypothetical protein P4O66_016518, partial [Electrophorus voltai]